MYHHLFAEPLRGPADELLRGRSSLTRGERELFAAYVSCGNECLYCTRSHAATARHVLADLRRGQQVVAGDLGA